MVQNRKKKRKMLCFSGTSFSLLSKIVWLTGLLYVYSIRRTDCFGFRAKDKPPKGCCRRSGLKREWPTLGRGKQLRWTGRRPATTIPVGNVRRKSDANSLNAVQMDRNTIRAALTKLELNTRANELFHDLLFYFC